MECKHARAYGNTKKRKCLALEVERFVLLTNARFTKFRKFIVHPNHLYILRSIVINGGWRSAQFRRSRVCARCFRSAPDEFQTKQKQRANSRLTVRIMSKVCLRLVSTVPLGNAGPLNEPESTSNKSQVRQSADAVHCTASRT